MTAIRWMLATVITLHSLIHLMGSLGAWGIADAQTQTGAPIVPLTGIWLYAFGFVWLAACLGLLASAILLALDREAWAPVALIGVALSQLAIVFWWTSAWRGTLVNLIVLAAIAWQMTLHARLHAASAPGDKRAAAL
jgi:hypothetical protein